MNVFNFDLFCEKLYKEKDVYGGERNSSRGENINLLFCFKKVHRSTLQPVIFPDPRVWHALSRWAINAYAPSNVLYCWWNITWDVGQHSRDYSSTRVVCLVVGPACPWILDRTSGSNCFSWFGLFNAGLQRYRYFFVWGVCMHVKNEIDSLFWEK